MRDACGNFKLICSVTNDVYFYAIKLQMINVLAGVDSGFPASLSGA